MSNKNIHDLYYRYLGKPASNINSHSLEELEEFEKLEEFEDLENLNLPSVPEDNLINKNINKNIKTTATTIKTTATTIKTTKYETNS